MNNVGVFHGFYYAGLLIYLSVDLNRSGHYVVRFSLELCVLTAVALYQCLHSFFNAMNKL